MIHKIVRSPWLFCAASIMVHSQVIPAQQSAIAWQSPAQLHRLLKKPVNGTLQFDDAAVEFRSQDLSHRWLYGEIRTFDLSGSRELLITDYGNRHWHEPGEQRFQFTLTQPIPPTVAKAFAARVARPVIDGDPEPAVASIAELPAHRRERFGGSNGRLRFRDDGIDYITPDGRGARAWRWSDIQTVASPNPWEFRVTAYREIVGFDLKQPLSRDLFDRIWDRLYAADLNLTPGKEAGRQ